MYIAQHADTAGFRETLHARGNVYAVTVKVTAFDDDVTEADADAEQNLLILGDPFIAFRDCLLMSDALLTASTALLNSTNAPSPVVLKIRPPFVMYGDQMTHVGATSAPTTSRLRQRSPYGYSRPHRPKNFTASLLRTPSSAIKPFSLRRS